MTSVENNHHNEFDVLIITKNSQRTIDLIVSFWRDFGIEPIIFLDDSSDPSTELVLKSVQARYYVVNNQGKGYPDGLTRLVKNFSNARWILRLDDDELPSRRMLSWVREFTTSGTDKWTAGFSRLQLLPFNGSVYFAAGQPFQTSWAEGYFAIQWKLFQPAHVEFVDAIHTPGFNNANFCLAPPDCSFAHFEWITQSYSERVSKMERYQSTKPGSAFYELSLFEHFPLSLYNLQKLDTSEFDSVTAKLAERRGVTRYFDNDFTARLTD